MRSPRWARSTRACARKHSTPRALEPGDVVSFDYTIVAHGDDADKVNKNIEAGVGRITTATATAGRAMETAFSGSGLRDAQGQFVATAVASEQLRAHVDELTGQWEREDAVLERIKGPARDFQNDLKALNALHEQGTISTKEHEAELERMQSRMKEGGGEGAVGKLEGVTGLATGLIAGGAAGEVVEFGKRIADMVEEGKRLHDEYINLSNSVQMFATSGRSADGILTEQLQLSEELHGKLEPTIALYQRVAENSDRLGLSHESQIRLTRSLGEAVQLANHPIEDAAGLMAKFGQAMETGQLDARGMNAIIREAPALVDVWKNTFNESTEQILKDLKDHKKSLEDLIQPLIKNGEVLDTMYDKRQRTNEQSKEELITAAKLVSQQEGVSFQAALLAGQLDEQGKAWLGVVDAGQAYDAMMRKVNATIESVTETAKTAQREFLGKMLDDTHSLITGIDQLGTEFEGIGRKMGALSDVWGTALGTQGKLIKASMEHASKVGEAKQSLETLHAEYKAGTINAMEYKAQSEALVTTIEGGISTWRKLDKEINEPIRNLNEEMHTLQAMYASGAIDFDGFFNRMQKVSKALNEQRAAVPLVPITLQTNIPSAEAGGFGGVDSSRFKSIADEGEKRNLDAMVSGSKATQKFSEDMTQLNNAEARHVITVDEHAAMVAKLRARYDDIKTPQDEWNRALEVASEKFKAGMYDADQYERAIAKINAQFDHGMGQGITNGLTKIREEMTNVAAVADKTMVDAFHNVEDAIVQAATTGKLSFDKFFADLEADFAKLALRQIESSIAPGLFPSLPQHAGGAEWTVGGTQGTDNSLQAFWASPGETVTVTPSGGGGVARQAPASSPAVHFHLHDDPRALVAGIGTAAGSREVHRTVARDPRAMQRLLR